MPNPRDRTWAMIDPDQALLENLHTMAAESRGAYGPGILSFRLIGCGHGSELFIAAELGDPLARSIVHAVLDFVSHTHAAPTGTTRCILCAGPFTAPPEQPWATLIVRAAIEEPTVFCCSGVCTACCTAMDWDELHRQAMQRYKALFPSLRALPPLVAKLGHA